MWKKLTAPLAAAALAACCPLSAGDSCKPGECNHHHDGKKDASCRKAENCAMQPGCCKHKKVVKITPIRKASESDPGFIAILEEYSVTTEVPVPMQQDPAAMSGGAKTETPAH